MEGRRDAILQYGLDLVKRWEVEFRSPTPEFASWSASVAGAVQTGMNAPGCRHSAKCRRAHEAWFEARKVSLAGNAQYSPSVAPCSQKLIGFLRVPGGDSPNLP